MNWDFVEAVQMRTEKDGKLVEAVTARLTVATAPLMMMMMMMMMMVVVMM